MTIVRPLRSQSPGLILGLALSMVGTGGSTALGQFNSSDVVVPGTGTGMSGPTLMLPGSRRYDPMPPGLPRVNRNESVPFGPGMDVTFPDEQPAIPLDALLGTDAGDPKASERSKVTELHFEYAKRIPVAGERSLALSRIASAATFSNQLDMAERALDLASEAAFATPKGLVQDQRLISILTALNNLADARLREGRSETMILPEADAKDEALPPKSDRTGIIRQAIADWKRAAVLAQRISSRTYQTEYMGRVAESMAYGSSSIVSDFPAEGEAGPKSKGFDESFGGLPDQLLQEAAQLSAKISRPVWHDHSLMLVASAAADSRQFARAIQIASQIPNHEVRSNAYIKIGEIQARTGDSDGATTTYRLAAESVASIPQDDPRAVIAGVLIDNLITVGRFEDARASVSLYPDEPRRVIALGAIAESQGRRGAGTSALQWINTEVPARYRSWLYRKVNNGVVAAIEQNRSRDLTNRQE